MLPKRQWCATAKPWQCTPKAGAQPLQGDYLLANVFLAADEPSG